MKLNCKQTSLSILILAIICLILQYVLCYWVGYFEKSYVPITIWRILGMVGFSLLFVQLFIWIFSLIRRNHRLWTTVMLISLFAFKWFEWFEDKLPPTTNLIVHGMRDRILRDYSLDTLRHFARDFDRLPTLPKQNVRYGAVESFKEYRNEDLTNTGLKDKYPFIAWIKSNGHEGPEGITEEDGGVYTTWGVRPYWGFSVAINGAKINPSTGSNIKKFRVSDDIYLYVNEGD
jgi:hypothetical protein